MMRAKHNLSNYKLLTCNQGELVPIGLTEVVRGDSIKQHSSAFIRVNPMLAPVMHPVHAKIHHWFVPHRLTWTDWQDFITGGPDGENASTHPTITFAGGVAVGSLGDYLGLPTGVNGIEVSALPFRAYALVWNKFYRDQDLQTKLTIDLTDGPDTTTNTTLQNACWQKDYFTTCRSEPQKGPEVTMPLAGTAEIESNGNNPTFNATGQTNQPIRAVTTTGILNMVNAPSANSNITWGDQTGLEAQLDTATGPSVNDVRLALALQRFQEARSRFGSEYVDYLNYYGIKSSDARLQLPEYLGGGRQTIQFSEVLATAEGDNTDVGDLKGHGIGQFSSNRYKKFFEEDGYIISLMVTQPITMYTQGVPRTWNRRTKEDYFQKELQHVGQMQVLYKELYAAHATPNGVFGYQDNYDDYRRIENTIAGDFRTTENYWHMGRIFASDPSLNSTFVSSNPTNRIYASTSTDQLKIFVRHTIHARRLVAKHGKSYIY